MRPLQPLALVNLALLARAGPVAAQGDAVLRGRVVSRDGGRPVEGALVTVDSAAPAHTDAAGRFTIPGLTVGSVHVLVRAIGFSPFRAIVGIGVRVTEPIRIELTPGAETLPSIEVEGQRERSGRLAGFDRRPGPTGQHLARHRRAGGDRGRGDYSGPATIPSEFAGARDQYCGLIVIWTR